MHDDTGQVIRPELAGMALDTHVAKAVGRVSGLERLARPTGRDNVVHLTRWQRAVDEWEVDVQVRGGDVAGRIDRLAVGQRDRGPGLPELPQPDPAVDVLAEIEHLSTGHATHAGRRQLLHGRTGGAGEQTRFA